MRLRVDKYGDPPHRVLTRLSGCCFRSRSGAVADIRRQRGRSGILSRQQLLSAAYRRDRIIADLCRVASYEPMRNAQRHFRSYYMDVTLFLTYIGSQ